MLEYGTQYSVALIKDLCRMSDPTFWEDSDLTFPMNKDYENHYRRLIDNIVGRRPMSSLLLIL